MTDYTETERQALENFVTDAKADIYAVRNLRPEVFGAFGSFFSRSPKDVRDHILDAITGDIKGHEVAGGSERLDRLALSREYGERSLAGASSEELVNILDRSAASTEEPAVYQPPQAALESGLEKAQSFFEKYYGTYGHKSIANTVWIPFVATYKSQLFARKLAEDQLAFFIEQSTRYVEFEDNYYRDPAVMESEHAAVYDDTIEAMLENYNEFAGLAGEFYRDRIPYDEWLGRQPDSVREKSDDFLERKYDREIDGKALDIARYLLPQAVQTNIAWILDARSTEFDVATWKAHPLAEIRTAAEEIEAAGGEIAPSLLKYTEESEFYGKKFETEIDPGVDPEPVDKGVSLLSVPDDLLEKVATHTLKEKRTGSYTQFREAVEEMDFDEKLAVLEDLVASRGQYDEWVGANEEFDLEKIVVEVRTDVGALRDIRRHQKNDRGENRYTLDMGYHRPDVVEEMPARAQELFDETMAIAGDAERAIREEFPFQAQYVLPMATMSTITMSLGLDQLQYLLYTRTTAEGNFSYREDMFNLAEAVLREEPWLLGLEEYPDGTDVRALYEDSEWAERLLWLDTAETGLHT